MYNLLNISTIAERKGITLKSLVDKAGITEAGFYKSLKTNSMNIKTLAAIAEILGVTVSELIGETSKDSLLNKSVVSSPIHVYEPPKDKGGQLQIMYEQQCEITKLEKDIKVWMERAYNAELELAKKNLAPDMDGHEG